MDDYFSEKLFLKRLKENAIDMSEKKNGKLYINHVILFEDMKLFPELKQTFVSMKDLFLVNDIFSVSILSKKAVTDYMYSDARKDVGCIAISLYGWIKKMPAIKKKSLKGLCLRFQTIIKKDSWK